LANLEKQSGATEMVQWAQRECPAFMLSLSNAWFPCAVRYRPNSMLMISDAAENIAGGMSGSPIVVPDGTAIGVVCLGSETGGQVAREGGPHPRLTGNLPGWLLKNLM
jgi:hypothetical protein